MASKKTSKKKNAAPAGESAAARTEIDGELRQAEDDLRQAEERLRKAQQRREEANRRQSEPGGTCPEVTVGRVIDGTLAFVKKYPGPSVVAAFVVGFFLNRILPR